MREFNFGDHGQVCQGTGYDDRLRLSQEFVRVWTSTPPGQQWCSHRQRGPPCWKESFVSEPESGIGQLSLLFPPCCFKSEYDTSDVPELQCFECGHELGGNRIEADAADRRFLCSQDSQRDRDDDPVCLDLSDGVGQSGVCFNLGAAWSPSDGSNNSIQKQSGITVVESSKQQIRNRFVPGRHAEIPITIDLLCCAGILS